MEETPESDLRMVKYLRALVTTLTVVMIVGFLVLIGFLVTRFPSSGDLTIPDQITLPDGTIPVAFTQTADWYAVVTKVNEILIFDRATGEILQKVAVGQTD